MKDKNINRRDFLRKATGAAVGTICFPYIVPSSALGKAGNIAPSNRIVMGCIGVGGKRPGGQGTVDLRGFLGRDEVQVIAVCDVDKNHRKWARDIVNEKYGNQDCSTHNDFRELLARGDIFEASHTYRLKGLNKFLTIVEAQAGGRRYYKAYLAERLDGQWMPLAAKKDKPFAGPTNTRHIGAHWTDLFSHGELIRDGYDQNLVVDPAYVRLLFQGVSDEDKRGKKYGEIPWRLGMLTPK